MMSAQAKGAGSQVDLLQGRIRQRRLGGPDAVAAGTTAQRDVRLRRDPDNWTFEIADADRPMTVLRRMAR